MNPSLCLRGAGYHDGFVIPAGATNIQMVVQRGAVSSATFQAGGAEWTYSNETIERLECTGPLNTGVDIQVNY